MRKQILTALLTALLGVTVCANEPTLEELLQNTKPIVMVEFKGGVTLDISYEGFADEHQNQAKLTRALKKEGEYAYVCEKSDYSEDEYAYYYFSTDPNEKLQYQTKTQMGTDELNDVVKSSVFDNSFLGYDSFDVEIASVEEEGDHYLVIVSVKSGEHELAKDRITVEKETGYVAEVRRAFANTETDDTDSAEKEQLSITKITYDPDVVVEPLFDAEKLSARLDFETVDVEGNPVTTDIIKDAKVVMVNFWEPWCGPCVGEMPEIQKLYEKYKEQGFLVLGAYSEENTIESVKEIIAGTGVQYPIIQKDQSLAIFCGNYVPVTIFADGEGNVLTEEPIIGAKTLDEWEEILGTWLSDI